MSTRYIAWYLIFAMFLIGIVPRVNAGLSPSEIISLKDLGRAGDLQKIQKILETKMVKERLKELGFTYEEIQNRLHQLSDAQIHELALKLDELKIGGDALGIIIALLVIAILVVLFLYLTGHRVLVTK